MQNNQHIPPATTFPVKVRHALVLHALSSKERFKEARTKKITVTRINASTKKQEVYVTERCNKYARSPVVKLLDIWCRLRSYAKNTGLINDHRTKMVEMARTCECSINKFRPAIKELHKMGWLTIHPDCIRITGEKDVYKLCGLDYFRKLDRIFFKPEKIKGERQTHYWLYLADIDDNRKRQAYRCHHTFMNDPGLKKWTYAYFSEHGHDIQKAETDPMYLCSILKGVYIESFHSRESDIHEQLVENRPDVNRGVNGMSDAWGTSPQNVSYIKKQLIKQDLAFIQKIGTISSPDRMRNKHVHLAVRDGIAVPRGVGWNKEDYCTFQAFCDDIVPRPAYNYDQMKFEIPEAA